MNIDTILLSEYASADATGRLTVVNAFNRLRGPGPKWGLPVMYLTLVAHGPKREAGRRWDGEIRLLNAKREAVNEQPMTFELRFPADDGSLTEGMPVRAVLCVAFGGLTFDAPGPYAFEVFVGGSYAAATTLFVEKTPGPSN